MQRVKRSTAVAVLPATPSGGTPGYFAAPDPAGGVPATVPGYEWYNAVQEEIVALIAAAGLALDPANHAQMAEAVQRLIDAQSGNYAIDTGVANAYVVALNPAIVAYTDGMTVRVKIVNANTAASTLNAGGGAVPLVNDVGGALVAGDAPAGGIITAIYIASAGKFYVTSLVPSQYFNSPVFFGTPTAPTPVQFDATTKIATMEAVQRALGNSSDFVIYTASAVMPQSDVGKDIMVAISGTLTLTLPDITGLRNGSRVRISNYSTQSISVVPKAGSTINNNNTIASLSIGINDSVTLALIGTMWGIVGGSAELPYSSLFGASIGGSGYQKLPSGLIIQWGAVAVTNTSQETGSAAVSFPIAYPNNVYAVTVSGDWSAMIAAYSSLGTSGFTALSTNRTSGVAVNGSNNIKWFSVGR